MASRPAQKAKARAANKNGGPPRQPKAGSVAQREMIEDIAQSMMNTDRAIFRAEVEMNRRGEADTEIASSGAQRLTNTEGDPITWKQHKEELQQFNRNLEASYPALAPLARKLVRRRRKEYDAAEE